MTQPLRPCILLLLCALAIGAPAEPVEDFHTWAAVVTTGTLGNGDSPYRYWLEAQGRYDDDSSHLNQSLLRGALGYAVAPRTVLWAGYAHVNNDPQGTDEDVTEHRYWQQLTWNGEGREPEGSGRHRAPSQFHSKLQCRGRRFSPCSRLSSFARACRTR